MTFIYLHLHFLTDSSRMLTVAMPLSVFVLRDPPLFFLLRKTFLLLRERALPRETENAWAARKSGKEEEPGGSGNLPFSPPPLVLPGVTHKLVPTIFSAK